MTMPDYFIFDVHEAAFKDAESKYSQWAFCDALDICKMVKSPIEGRLAIWLNCRFNMIWVEKIPDKLESTYTYCIPQAPIGPYKVDFLIINTRHDGKLTRLVVECDGHDFHEKTKEQVAHGKKRDRYMTKDGYKVLRFSGYEIHKMPAECCDDITSCIYGE